MLVFGNTRVEPGLLVEPATGTSVPPGDAQKLEEYKTLIWYVLLLLFRTLSLEADLS